MKKVVLLSKKPLISVDVSAKDVKKYLERKQSNMAKAVSATASDFRSKAPGWVSKEVRDVYGVDAKAVKSAKRKVVQDGTITIGLERVKNYKIVYRGRALFANHFSAEPKKRKKGETNPAPATVEFHKGKRSPASEDAFFQKKNGREAVKKPAFVNIVGKTGQSMVLAREGDERYSISPLSYISVPEMIQSEKDGVADNVSRIINQNMEKRLEHNIKRFGKR